MRYIEALYKFSAICQFKKGNGNTSAMIDQVIVLVILLFVSAFFSASETALYTISRTKARHLAKDKARAFTLIWRMKEDPHRLLTTVLIGNNLANVGASALATTLALRLFPDYALGIATGIMTLLILVFGEVFPKSLATRNNILIGRLTIYPIYWLSIVFVPIIFFLNFIPLLTGKVQKIHKVTEEELMTFVEVVEEDGEIKEEEREMIHSIFEFDDTSASEIMTPRADMFVVQANAPMPMEEIARSGYTRIPVIDGNIDHVIGILNVKDLFMHQIISETPVDIQKIIREPYFVPENKKLDKLLHQFKKRKQHMAIVVDEYGGVSGLITLEDTIEEIFGEISDETDKEEPHIVSLGAKEWVVLGKSEVDEVNAKTGMSIPESYEYDTFSGYILEKTGRIPRENEEIALGKFAVIVRKMDGNRISEFLVKLK